MKPRDVDGLLLAVALAGLCYSLARLVPETLWFSVPLSVAGLILMDGRS
jgi:hypothetical protein